MIGVAESLGHNGPCLFPLKTLLVHQDALELNDSKSWVRIIELNSHLLRELLPGALALLESTNDIVQGSSNPEVLLLQAELLPAVQVVIRV